MANSFVGASMNGAPIPSPYQSQVWKASQSLLKTPSRSEGFWVHFGYLQLKSAVVFEESVCLQFDACVPCLQASESESESVRKKKDIKACEDVFKLIYLPDVL